MWQGKEEKSEVPMPRLLVVDDEEHVRDVLTEALVSR